MSQNPDNHPANEPRLVRIRHLEDRIGMYSNMVKTMKAQSSPSDEYLADLGVKEAELSDMKAELASLTTKE